MYFVICVFMALCGLVTEILFTEMFHTWFKVVLAVGSSASAGYAITRGLRFVAKQTKWFASPALMTTFYIAWACVLVIVIIVTLILKARKKKAA